MKVDGVNVDREESSRLTWLLGSSNSLHVKNKDPGSRLHRPNPGLTPSNLETFDKSTSLSLPVSLSIQLE